MRPRMLRFENKKVSQRLESGESADLQGYTCHALIGVYGAKEMEVILHWEDGYLSDDGKIAAVRFADGRQEYFTGGKFKKAKGGGKDGELAIGAIREITIME